MNKFNSWNYLLKFLDSKRLEDFCNKYLIEYNEEYKGCDDWNGAQFRPLAIAISLIPFIVVYIIGRAQ